ncbi:MAG: serine/threonine-protein phosphatase [Deltaproteobacteria bacterium]|nr:serine/threonine-protein phosphatase [Deltaproteobacteria bacterium]
MSHPEKKSQPIGKRVSGLRRFASAYAGNVRGEDVRRLFQRDAGEAISLLIREQSGGRESPEASRGLWCTARDLFLGLSFKLSPVRRMLFAASMIAVLLGMFDFSAELQLTPVFYLDFSPVWFLTSIGLLVFLLILELVDRVRVRDELAVARQLQRDLLPDGEISLAGVEVSHSYRTATAVGGDFYDFSSLPDGRMAFIIGDASGHGMAAGLLMATAKATLGVAMDLDPDPVKVVSLLNRRLCLTADRRAFMTLFFSVYDPSTGVLEWVCAGHPFPWLRRPNGSLEELGKGGLPLGLKADLEVESSTVTLGAGDLLLLYTDGLAEAVDEKSGEAFGFDQVGALLAEGGSPQEVAQRVLAALDRHLGEEAAHDDVSLAVLSPTGTATSQEVLLPPLPV